MNERDLNGLIQSLYFKSVSETVVVKVCGVIDLVRKRVMRVCLVALTGGCCVFHCMARSVWGSGLGGVLIWQCSLTRVSLMLGDCLYASIENGCPCVSVVVGRKWMSCVSVVASRE